MKIEEKELLLDCKSQFEWLAKNDQFGITTSTKTIIGRIEKVLVHINVDKEEGKEEIKEKKTEHFISDKGHNILLATSLFLRDDGEEITPAKIEKAIDVAIDVLNILEGKGLLEDKSKKE